MSDEEISIAILASLEIKEKRPSKRLYNKLMFVGYSGVTHIFHASNDSLSGLYPQHQIVRQCSSFLVDYLVTEQT